MSILSQRHFWIFHSELCVCGASAQKIQSRSKVYTFQIPILGPHEQVFGPFWSRFVLLRYPCLAPKGTPLGLFYPELRQCLCKAWANRKRPQRPINCISNTPIPGTKLHLCWPVWPKSAHKQKRTKEVEKWHSMSQKTPS